MAYQVLDIDAIDLEIEEKIQKCQQEFCVSDADIAWILLRLGTHYYFKDISSRAMCGSPQ